MLVVVLFMVLVLIHGLCVCSFAAHDPTRVVTKADMQSILERAGAGASTAVSGDEGQKRRKLA